MLRVLALASVLSACSLVFPNRQPAQPVKAKPTTRAEFEAALRAELDNVPGDACAKAAWLGKQTGREGLEGEVAEELRAESDHACKLKTSPRLAAKSDADEAAVEIAFDGACTRAGIEQKLRDANAKRVDEAAIEDAFARCFATKLKECQTALDADVDEGVACWRKQSFTEVPKAVEVADVGATTMCLGELKAVVSDLRACRSKKKQDDRDACATPYVGYVPKCPLLDPNRAWLAFPGHEDVERVANADARRRAEREAKVAKEKAEREERIAKETERCFGRTTIEFAERLRASPGPRTVPGCQYEVSGNVISHNNVYVQLVDKSGTLVMLLRTRESFTDGSVIANRVGTFDSIEEAELADGTKRQFPVFKLSAK